MIKVLIIDDEPLAAELVKEYLTEFPDFEILQVCHDGFSGLKAIQDTDPDLIFLDVQMPKLNGFELLELLDDPPAVIFTTAFDEYALKAFDNFALDYLLKPFSKTRFTKALTKFRMQQGNTGLKDFTQHETPVAGEMANRIVLKDRNEIKIIAIQEVNYFEANDDYVNIVTKEGKFLKNKTLSSFERVLDSSQFVRVHRSYIVKVSEITKMEVYEKDSFLLKLKSGATIPVSKTGLPKLKAVLGI